MKKILVLVMVLLLVGCQPKNEMTVVNNDEVLEKLDELDTTLDTTFHEMYLDFQEMKNRLDTIDMNIDRIEDGREFSNQAIQETFDEYKLCYIDLLGDIFSDFNSTGTIDDVYSWRYDWHNDTIYYKNTENSEEKSITITEIVEEECE